MNDPVWQLLADELGTAPEVELAAGGCIHHSAVLDGPSGKLFVKTNSADKLPMFACEEYALRCLADTQTVLVPGVSGRGVVGDFAYLALEFVPMVHGKPRQFHLLGEQLAAMHKASSPAVRPGYYHDNFIGTTPQPNPWTDSWATFFSESRIGYQLELAAGRGAGFAHGEKLVARIPDLLEGHEPQPTLLHGDLWGGNVGFTPLGAPVIFDPACYYGDRECDIAFSQMFGGFEPEFYSGYRMVYPLEEGYEQRRELYNLYHVLNHYNLFGRSYGEQAEAMIRKLLVGF